MKRILLFAFGALLFTASQAQVVTYTDDFESYTEGDHIGEMSDNWDTWSNNGAGTSEDATVSTDFAQSGMHSLKFDATTEYVDNVLLLGNFMGMIQLEWSVYITAGEDGYFNAQESNTPGVGWGFECYLLEDGSVQVIQDGVDLSAGATYNHDAWNSVVCTFDLDNDVATISINGTDCGGDIVWDTPVGSINFYANDGAGGGQVDFYYIDDVTVTDMTVSVEEIGFTPEFNVYPMPANDVINLDWNFAETVQASIIDLNGKKVYSDQINAFNNTRIDISELREGIYFVQITDGTLNMTKKIIVKH